MLPNELLLREGNGRVRWQTRQRGRRDGRGRTGPPLHVAPAAPSPSAASLCRIPGNQRRCEFDRLPGAGGRRPESADKPRRPAAPARRPRSHRGSVLAGKVAVFAMTAFLPARDQSVVAQCGIQRDGTRAAQNQPAGFAQTSSAGRRSTARENRIDRVPSVLVPQSVALPRMRGFVARIAAGHDRSD